MIAIIVVFKEKPMLKICVFAGSSSGHDAELMEITRRIGGMAAARNIGVVYGGGRTGLMGAIADGALEAGGFVHGIIPKFLATLEVAHEGVSELTITDDMHQRKKIMHDNSDAFLALPGGFGTMEETMEAITWRQLRSHNKPIFMFDYKGFWDNLLSMWHHSSEQGFIKPAQLGLVDSLDTLDDVADCFDRLKSSNKN
jgi:uncharacterized protein (TIGR00730 family)